MKIIESHVPVQKISRRGVLATGLKIAAIGGTAALSATGLILPGKAPGSTLHTVSPAITPIKYFVPVKSTVAPVATEALGSGWGGALVLVTNPSGQIFL